MTDNLTQKYSAILELVKDKSLHEELAVHYENGIQLMQKDFLTENTLFKISFLYIIQELYIRGDVINSNEMEKISIEFKEFFDESFEKFDEKYDFFDDDIEKHRLFAKNFISTKT